MTSPSFRVDFRLDMSAKSVAGAIAEIPESDLLDQLLIRDGKT